MRRSRLIASVAMAFSLGSAANAIAGGTMVLAPEVPAGEDCSPGSEPRIEGAPIEVFVLGCVRPPGSGLVVTAAHAGHQFASVYVTPPSGRDLGVSNQVSGQMTAKLRSHSPMTGGKRFALLRVARYPSGTYASGIAPAGMERITVGVDGERVRAPKLEVRSDLAKRLGATHAFAVFAARLPERMDTCAGLWAFADAGNEELRGQYRESRNSTYPEPRSPLRGSKGCATSGAWDVGEAVEAVGKALERSRRS